ncbi:unnamed protein product [Fusarium graminearum]|nr:unnamed protein product [Fusarium graminearum]
MAQGIIHDLSLSSFFLSFYFSCYWSRPTLCAVAGEICIVPFLFPICLHERKGNASIDWCPPTVRCLPSRSLPSWSVLTEQYFRYFP